MSQKIAILTTGAVTESGFAESDEPSFRLRSLLSSGYRVIVVSSRTTLTSHDDRWKALLPISDIHLAPRRVADAHCPEYVAVWRGVFDELGLTHPTKTISWLNWQAAAKEQGVAIG